MARTVTSKSRTSRPFELPHNPRESELHVSVAQFLDWALIPPDTIYTTFPAGWGKLTKGTAGRLRASGMRKGMPDILVFTRRDHHSTYILGIELKVGHNSVSSAQRTTFAALQAVGIRVVVCRCIEDVEVVLKQEQIPCRARTSGNGQQFAPTEPSGPVRPDFFRPQT